MRFLPSPSTLPATRSMALSIALLVALTAALGTAGCSRGRPDVTDVAPDTIAAQLGRPGAPLIVDVRSPEEYRAGHIPGAVNIPYEQIAARADELVSDTGVAIYCGVGPRARKGEALLLGTGYGAPVYHIDGGMTAWTEQSLPVAAPGPTSVALGADGDDCAPAGADDGSGPAC